VCPPLCSWLIHAYLITPRAEKKHEILDCPNYKAFGKPPALFDPDKFDLAAVKERVAAALSSSNSVRSGAKKFHMPIMPDMPATAYMNLKKGESIVQSHEQDERGNGYWQEVVSERRDHRSVAVCGACGKPGGEELKTCGGCRQIL
jgi:hypothetical protein